MTGFIRYWRDVSYSAGDSSLDKVVSVEVSSQSEASTRTWLLSLARSREQWLQEESEATDVSRTVVENCSSRTCSLVVAFSRRLMSISEQHLRDSVSSFQQDLSSPSQFSDSRDDDDILKVFQFLGLVTPVWCSQVSLFMRLIRDEFLGKSSSNYTKVSWCSSGWVVSWKG